MLGLEFPGDAALPQCAWRPREVHLVVRTADCRRAERAAQFVDVLCIGAPGGQMLLNPFGDPRFPNCLLVHVTNPQDQRSQELIAADGDWEQAPVEAAWVRVSSHGILGRRVAIPLPSLPPAQEDAAIAPAQGAAEFIVQASVTARGLSRSPYFYGRLSEPAWLRIIEAPLDAIARTSKPLHVAERPTDVPAAVKDSEPPSSLPEFTEPFSRLGGNHQAGSVDVRLTLTQAGADRPQDRYLDYTICNSGDQPLSVRDPFFEYAHTIAIAVFDSEGKYVGAVIPVLAYEHRPGPDKYGRVELPPGGICGSRIVLSSKVSVLVSYARHWEAWHRPGPLRTLVPGKYAAQVFVGSGAFPEIEAPPRSTAAVSNIVEFTVGEPSIDEGTRK